MPEKAFIAAGCGSACGGDEAKEAKNAAEAPQFVGDEWERRGLSSRTSRALPLPRKPCLLARSRRSSPTATGCC